VLTIQDAASPIPNGVISDVHPITRGTPTDKLRTLAIAGPALEHILGSDTSEVVDATKPGAKGMFVNHRDDHGDGRTTPCSSLPALPHLQ
jgi:hypothetical protein